MKRILLIAVLLSLAGCGKGVDDTVLPGTREDAIPGQSVFPAPGEEKLSQPVSNTEATGEPADQIAAEPQCPNPDDPNDPNCAQDTSSGDGTFSDGQ